MNIQNANLLSLMACDTQSDADDLILGGDSDVGDNGASASQRSTSTCPETNCKKSDLWNWDK